jgi:hypothetical protein
MASPKPTPAAVNAPAKLHDALHQVRLVAEALRSEKRRIGFFLGAGCPLGIYDEAGTAPLKLIPDVTGLTYAIEGELASDKANATHLANWTKLKQACGGAASVNVEHILTQLRTICALKGDSAIDGMAVGDLRLLDNKICGCIA